MHFPFTQSLSLFVDVKNFPHHYVVIGQSNKIFSWMNIQLTWAAWRFKLEYYAGLAILHPVFAWKIITRMINQPAFENLQSIILKVPTFRCENIRPIGLQGNERKMHRCCVKVGTL